MELILSKPNRGRSAERGPICRNGFISGNGDWWHPILGGPSSLLSASKSLDAIGHCRRLFDDLSEDRYLTYVKEFYDAALSTWGTDWIFHDINTVLFTAGQVMRPSNYLEIGVRRGRSAAMLLSQSQECRFVAFDMWIEDYAGMENPGPDFVRQELRRLGHKGECEFVDGNSRETVPRYFATHPKDHFDVVTVDGDHTTGGAAADLRNVIDRVKVGGLLIFDDTNNAGHPGLAAVWNRVVGQDPRFVSVEFNEIGFGIAVAMRKF